MRVCSALALAAGNTCSKTRLPCKSPCKDPNSTVKDSVLLVFCFSHDASSAHVCLKTHCCCSQGFPDSAGSIVCSDLNRVLVCSRDKCQTQVPNDSARSSPVTVADTKLTSLMQPGLTQQPDAPLSCEQHEPDDVSIEPSPIGSLDSFASAAGLSLARKQKAGSAGVDSSYSSAESAAACSTTLLHSATADTALIGSAASAQHPQCKSAQQSVLYAPAFLPNRPAFPRGSRAPNLDQFAIAPQASTLQLCWLCNTDWQRGICWH